MSDVTRLPIRRRGNFDLADEMHHAFVGEIEVLAARVITTAGPETWAIILRSPGEPDAMPCSLRNLGHENFGQAVGDLAATVEATLRMARHRAPALCADDSQPHGAA